MASSRSEPVLSLPALRRLVERVERSEPAFFFLAVVAMTAAGCYLGVPPDSRDGVLLPDTDDVSPLSFDFAVSPGGHSLLINVDRNNSTVPQLVVYDVETQRRRMVWVDEDSARRMRGGDVPLLESYRWTVRGDAVVFRSRYGQQWYGITIPESTEDRPVLAIVQHLEGIDFAPRSTPSVRSLVRVEVGPYQAKILSASGRTLARHLYLRPAVSDVHLELSDLSVSPDGRYLGYVVGVDELGFAGYSPGYVLCLDGKRGPQFLGSPIYGKIEWDAEHRRAFAYANDENGIPGIYHWEY